MKGRKRAIWVSVSNDLKYDAERDLRDIGANKIEVHALNKVIMQLSSFILTPPVCLPSKYTQAVKMEIVAYLRLKVRSP